MMDLLNVDLEQVKKGKVKRSDKIEPLLGLNYRGVLDAATNVPVVGDVLSGGLAAYDLSQGDYGSAALNALGVLPFVSGTFIGKGAKAWDSVKEADALKRIKSGEDRAKVWLETGVGEAPWQKAGTEQALRGEVDDSGARLRDYFYTPREAYLKGFDGTPQAYERSLQMKPYSGMTLKQLKDEYKRTGGEIVDAAMSGNKELALQLSDNRAGLDSLFGIMGNRPYGPMSNYMAHGELGKAYPDVYKLHTRIDSDLGDARGQYFRGDSGQAEQFVLRDMPRFSDNKSTMLHEAQHAIQNREGWARGGNPRDIARNPQNYVSQDVIEYAKSLPAYQRNDPEEFIKSFAAMRLGHPDDAYQRLAGEAEARLTQHRMNLTPQERLQQYPYDPAYFKQATGVDINDLIVRGLLDQ